VKTVENNSTPGFALTPENTTPDYGIRARSLVEQISSEIHIKVGVCRLCRVVVALIVLVIFASLLVGIRVGVKRG
jgi:hypothetical protein